MTTIDPSIMISRFQQLGSDLAGLGQALGSAAPTGGFDQVLAQINSDMRSIEDPQAGPATASAGAGAGTPLTSASAAASGGFLLAAAAGGGGLTPSSAGTSAASLAAMGAPLSAGGSSPGSQVVADAERYLGVPYAWGGTSPTTGFDCSGLVQHVYADLGISLPRTSEGQATVGTPVAGVAQAQPGDLVFFAGSDGTASAPGHVGIYIGNGQMIDAPHTGASVRIDPVGQPVAIRRILPTSQSAAGPVLAAYTAASGAGTDPQMTALGVPAALQPLFASAGSRYGIDPMLLAAVAKQESGFNSSAVSAAGAQGLMQLMPATAAGLGVNAYDPAQAIDGAAQMLSGYLQQYGGSIPLTLAAYNAGPGAVASYGGVPPYAQTQSYVADITSMLGTVA